MHSFRDMRATVVAHLNCAQLIARPCPASAVAVLGAEAAYTRTQLGESDKGRPEWKPVGAGMAGTAAVRVLLRPSYRPTAQGRATAVPLGNAPAVLFTYWVDLHVVLPV